MHAHQSRDHAVTVQVENLRIFRNIRRREIGHRIDLSLFENDRLIFPRRSASTVDHPHMCEHYDRGVDLHKTVHQRRESLRRGNGSHDQNKDEC
jgi:hypothetical protein